jgi:hypothetical protein
MACKQQWGMPAAKHRLSGPDLRLQERLRRVGLGLLLGGMLASAAVFSMTEPDDADEQFETKKYDYQMEVIGGKTNLFATEVTTWIAGLWHGRQLARTILVLSATASFGCFFVAHRLHFGPPAAEPEA